MPSLLGKLLPRFTNSLENPRVSLNDPRAWDELFGLNLSDTGIRVTPQTAIGYAPLWRGINLIANTVMKLPLHVYRQPEAERGSGERGSGGEQGPPEIELKHPAYYLVHWKANPFLTAGTWKQVMVYHALFRGNGYSAILRNGRGDPIELLPLSPTDTVPVQENGKLWYASKIGKEKRKIAPQDMFHLKGLSYDGLVGHDVLTCMKDELGVAIGARKYASKFFANGASTGGVLMIPRSFSEAAAKQLKKDWKDYSEGLDNAFRTAVLEDGAKWLATTFNPEQSQMIEARRFSVIDVANILGLAPHKLGDNSRMAYNSIEAENNASLDDSYDPWLFRIEEEADDKLLSETQKYNGSHFFGFDRRPLRKPDQKTQSEIDDKEVNAGLRTLNEIRARNNEPPLPPELGDKIRLPAGVVLVDPATGIATPTDPAADDTTDEPRPEMDKPAPEEGASAVRAVRNEQLEAAHRALLADRLDRFAAIDEKNAGKPALAGQQDKFCAAVGPVVAAIAAAGGSPQLDSLVLGYLGLPRAHGPTFRAEYDAWRDKTLQDLFPPPPKT